MKQGLWRIAFVALFLSAFAIESFAQAPTVLSTRDVGVHGHHLAFHVLPGRLPASHLVFIPIAIWNAVEN